MCFILHLASQLKLETFAWNPDDRHVWVGAPHGDPELVKSHFSLPEVAYIGSDMGCGCGFRSIVFQSGGWPEEWIIDQGECDPPDSSLQNHQELHDLIRPFLEAGEAIELYGCWDGEESYRTEHQEEIRSGRLLEPNFWFRQRGLYKIQPANRSVHWTPF